MSDLEMTVREFYLYIIIGGAIFGAILGILPLILGRNRGKARLGIYGLIASAVAGAISIILSLIVVALFSWLIVRKPAAAPGSSESSGDDAPTN